jgi:phenylalanyl-tRNA synthetase beta chain
MIYGLLDTQKKNANNACFDLKIFEMGRTFISRGSGEKLPEEKNILAGLLAGAVSEDIWGSKTAVDFYDIKGCLENVFSDLKLDNIRYISDAAEPFLHPGKSCSIYDKSIKIGYIGEVHPNVCEKMDLKNNSYVFEINLDILADHLKHGISCLEISKFPAIMRDVAFVIPSGMQSDNMLDNVLNQKEDLLENVNIFDIYEGKGLPEGTKSLGLRFSYRAADRTLTDAEVNNVHEKIVGNTVQLTGAKIRGE